MSEPVKISENGTFYGWVRRSAARKGYLALDPMGSLPPSDAAIFGSFEKAAADLKAREYTVSYSHHADWAGGQGSHPSKAGERLRLPEAEREAARLRAQPWASDVRVDPAR